MGFLVDCLILFFHAFVFTLIIYFFGITIAMGLGLLEYRSLSTQIFDFIFGGWHHFQNIILIVFIVSFLAYLLDLRQKTK